MNFFPEREDTRKIQMLLIFDFNSCATSIGHYNSHENEFKAFSHKKTIEFP